MNDLILALLTIFDEYTTGDPADDRVDYDRLQLCQEVAAALWEDGWRKLVAAEYAALAPLHSEEVTS